MTTVATACRRQALSMWSVCTCPDCRALRCSTAKAARTGTLPPRRSKEAQEVVRAWYDRGWSTSAVVSVTGLDRTVVESFYRRYLIVVRERQYGRTLSERIIAAAGRTPTEGSIGAVGTQRRLQALAFMGWDLTSISARTGVTENVLLHVRSGKQTRVKAAAAARVAAVFDKVSMTPGPSKRTATIATRRYGWAPPLAWDDDTIDDPTATPATSSPATVHVDDVDEVAVARAIHGTDGPPVRLNRAERRIVVEELLRRGVSHSQIADRVGVTPRTIERDIRDLRTTAA